MKEEVSMSITLRPSTLDDAKQCGEICYSAFRAIAEEHNFPPDFLPNSPSHCYRSLWRTPTFTELLPNLTAESSVATSSMNVRSSPASVRLQSIPPCKTARLDAS